MTFEWYKAVITADIKDKGKVLFSKGEEIMVKKGLNRLDLPCWEVVNHKFRNGFMLNDHLEILGEAYPIEEEEKC